MDRLIFDQQGQYYCKRVDAVNFLALARAFPEQCPLLLSNPMGSDWNMLLMLPRDFRVYGFDEGEALLRDLAQLPRFFQQAREAVRLPFTGGYAGFLAYELASWFEKRVLPWDSSAMAGAPLGVLARFPACILFSHHRQETFVVAETRDEMDEVLRLIELAPPLPDQFSPPVHCQEDAPELFLEGVDKILKFIAEGDVFQVNLSRQWQADFAHKPHPADIFAQLLQKNPAPFSALFQINQDTAIISASPERLISVNAQGIIETRPIAGTHPRALDPVEDEKLAKQLKASLKERAEHVMIIDLERNDLGRICQAGSIRVHDLMMLTRYAFVHHIESIIRGELRSGLSLADIFRAVFPGGTITGCPKVRCMQIIRELETAPRLSYTGSIFYINHDGRMDSNILIRSFLQRENSLIFRAGAGIVADSVAEKELAETRHKARGLLRALGLEA